MLKRLRIQNYLSCQNVVIDDLSNITALIGRNGAGKTNIMRALNWLVYVSTKARHPHEPFRSLWPGSDPTRVEIEAVIGKRTYSYSVERAYRHPTEKSKRWDLQSKETFNIKENGQESERIFDRHNQEVHTELRESPVKLGTMAGSLIGLESILAPADPLLKAIRPMISFLSSVRYYPIDEPCEPDVTAEHSGFIAEKTYQDWVAKYNETGNPGDSVTMRLLHMHQSKRERYEQLQALIGADGLDLVHRVFVRKYDMTSPEEDATFFELRFWPTQCVSRDRRGFTYNQLSTGTRRILKILVSLLFDDSKVMLLEHPEDGIHTLLVKRLVSLLKAHSFPTQILMTSHSSSVLNELDPTDIRIVWMKQCETRVRALKTTEIRNAARYMAEEGTLSEFIELAEA